MFSNNPNSFKVIFKTVLAMDFYIKVHHLLHLLNVQYGNMLEMLL